MSTSPIVKLTGVLVVSSFVLTSAIVVIVGASFTGLTVTVNDRDVAQRRRRSP